MARADEAIAVFDVDAVMAHLSAAMRGDSTRFTRQDGVEETWRIMQPLLDAAPPVIPYEQGSWGPPEADRLLAGLGRWHEPWVGS